MMAVVAFRRDKLGELERCAAASDFFVPVPLGLPVPPGFLPPPGPPTKAHATYTLRIGVVFKVFGFGMSETVIATL